MKPNLPKIEASSLPEPDESLVLFLDSYNLVLDQLTQLFNGNISAPDNIAQQYFATTFTTPSNYAAGGFNSIAFQCSFSRIRRPTVLLIGQIQASNGIPILTTVGQPMWSFVSVKNSISVSYISGLIASNKYNVTFKIE